MLYTLCSVYSNVNELVILLAYAALSSVEVKIHKKKSNLIYINLNLVLL
jgi:hypothetical protein